MNFAPGSTLRKIVLTIAVICGSIVLFVGYLVAALVFDFRSTSEREETRIGKARLVQVRDCPVVSPHGGCYYRSTFTAGSQTWDKVSFVAGNSDGRFAFVHLEQPGPGLIVDTTTGRSLGGIEEFFGSDDKTWHKILEGKWCGHPESYFSKTQWLVEPGASGLASSRGGYVLDRLSVTDGRFASEVVFSPIQDATKWRYLQDFGCSPRGELFVVLVGPPARRLTPEERAKLNVTDPDPYAEEFRANPGPAELLQWKSGKGLVVIDRWDWNTAKPDTWLNSFVIEFGNDGEPSWCLSETCRKARSL